MKIERRINTRIRKHQYSQAKKIKDDVGWGKWIGACIYLFFSDKIFENKVLSKCIEGHKLIKLNKRGE